MRPRPRHRRTVIILWAWTALLCGFVLLPLYDTEANIFIPLGVGVLVIALFTWFSTLLWRRRRRREEADLADEPVSS